MTDFDEEELRIQNERKKHDLEQREKDDIKFVMDSEQGRRVVWSLLEKGQVFGTCFNVDPNITAFNEGQRNLGAGFVSARHGALPRSVSEDGRRGQ